MDHLAIMRKSWGLTKKILSGEKKIESRWYNKKYLPWNKIKQGDRIYFKDSGEPVTVGATVSKVIQFDKLKPKKVREILNNYGQSDGLGTNDLPKFYEMFKNKEYCILIFLKNPKRINEPFEINKKRYGAMAAWICVENIAKIRKDI